jgi:hypothetical protein
VGLVEREKRSSVGAAVEVVVLRTITNVMQGGKIRERRLMRSDFPEDSRPRTKT